VEHTPLGISTGPLAPNVMEIDSAIHVAQEVAHVAEEAIEAYDTLEAYKVCGQSLREAYVGLKRIRKV
jgi:hypothetical protein